jgi:hypothetical protein
MITGLIITNIALLIGMAALIGFLIADWTVRRSDVEARLKLRNEYRGLYDHIRGYQGQLEKELAGLLQCRLITVDERQSDDTII